jgi:hypothetical protein
MDRRTFPAGLAGVAWLPVAHLPWVPGQGATAEIVWRARSPRSASRTPPSLARRARSAIDRVLAATLADDARQAPSARTV